MYKSALNIGTAAGIVSFGLFLIMYYIGLSPLGVFKIIGLPIPIIAIIWAMIKTRNQALGGYIRFMQAFLVGSVTVLVWCTFKGFCMYIFMTVFDQEVIAQYVQFWKDYKDFAIEMGSKQSANMIDLELIEKEATPTLLMFKDISDNLMFGSIVSIIVAIIVKRVPRQ